MFLKGGGGEHMEPSLFSMGRGSMVLPQLSSLRVDLSPLSLPRSHGPGGPCLCHWRAQNSKALEAPGALPQRLVQGRPSEGRRGLVTGLQPQPLLCASLACSGRPQECALAWSVGGWAVGRTGSREEQQG